MDHVDESPARLSQLLADTVLRVTGDECPGPSSFANVLTILPLQHRGFWDSPQTKDVVSRIQSDIRDQLQELRVESSGEQIASLASGLSHAAASSLDKHSDLYIEEFSARLGADIPKVSALCSFNEHVINAPANNELHGRSLLLSMPFKSTW